MEHGKVIIGTKLSTSQLEKDLTKAEKDLNKFSKEEDKLLEKKQRLEIDTAKTENNLQKVDDKLELINKQIADMERANLPENLVGNIDYQKLINQREELNRKGTIGLQTLDLQKGKLTQINSQLENNRKKQDELNKRLKLSNIEFDKANKGLTKTIKKVAKWGLAIFGVRSAYMAVRSAMNTISQYEDGMKNNIDYIKYALAYTLKPIVEWILNAVVKLLQYINYIAKAWTGKNLFKTADAFKNAQKGAKDLNKELQKTTASFDEMNVLQDTKSSGGGADIIAPNIDLTGMQGEVPQWLKWLVDNKDLILSVFAGVNVGLLAWKLGLKGIKSLGIGLAIAGVIYGIQSIIKYLQDPSFENFGKIITGIGIAVAGVAIIFGAWPVAVGGAIAAIIGIIISNWGKIKAFVLNICKWLEKHFGLAGKAISEVIKNNLLLFEGFFIGVKQILDGIIKIFKGDFKNGISLAMRGIGNIIISVLNAVINGFNAFILPIRGLIVAAGKITGKKWTMDTIKIPRIPKLAKGGIINQPGRGVPIGYGQAIGGENRAEGVIPLTDSQQMALLGEAIGKYININATIPIYMGNRQIAREIKKINAQNDFAFNK